MRKKDRKGATMRAYGSNLGGISVKQQEKVKATNHYSPSEGATGKQLKQGTTKILNSEEAIRDWRDSCEERGKDMGLERKEERAGRN